jgi:hypothetical protein
MKYVAASCAMTPAMKPRRAMMPNILILSPISFHLCTAISRCASLV